MKNFFIFFILFQTSIYYPSHAQIADNFADGNFVTNPIWFGDTSNYAVNTEGQLQLLATAEAG